MFRKKICHGWCGQRKKTKMKQDYRKKFSGKRTENRSSTSSISSKSDHTESEEEFIREPFTISVEDHSLERIQTTSKFQPKGAKIKYNSSKYGVCIGSDEYK